MNDSSLNAIQKSILIDKQSTPPHAIINSEQRKPELFNSSNNDSSSANNSNNTNNGTNIQKINIKIEQNVHLYFDLNK